jgi:PAS domain S-box-containing protein
MWIGMILLDDRLVIRQSNGAAASQLRCNKDALNGTMLQDLLPDERLMKAAKSIATGLVRRRCSVAVEHTSQDGGRSVLRCSVRPVRKSEYACVLLVIEDVTQQHEADRARSELVAQAAHELRTPLTNIRLYIEELLDGFDAMSATERGESLSVINQETRRLERIVSDMLSMSEIEAGKLSIVHDDVRMEDVLGALRNDYSAMARDKGLTLVFDLSPKLPVLRGDRDKISLAMHNLVSNALKYTPPGGEVRVTAESEPDRFVFQVSDTGIGIKADQMDRIFERFYRCKDERTVDVAGTGLGLSLAREVARLHGGDVTADSVPDKGSTFILELPTAA